MRSFLIASIVTSTTMFTLVAGADPKSAEAPRTDRDAKQMVTDDCARARKANKTCVLDMGKEDLEAGVSRPDSTRLSSLQLGWLGSMIRLRKDFIVEIVNSAEDID